MINQKALFNLDQNVHYLNCAAYGPLPKNSVQEGIEGIKLKENPFNISPKTHFQESEIGRNLFARLIHCDNSDKVAIIPSVSYGMAIVAANLYRITGIENKESIISLKNEFPNDFYAFERVLPTLNLKHNTLEMPENIETLGADWNNLILDSITNKVAAIIIPHVHWIYGVVFNLEAISKKCKQTETLLIIDGSQSIGALDFNVKKIKPDAVICPAYKWLLGPYSCGFMYLNSFFDNGIPIEETWMNRSNSMNFADLTNFESKYYPKAQRYNMGEFSQFATMPIAIASLDQLLTWEIKNITEFISELSNYAVIKLKKINCSMAEDAYRSSHLFGIFLPKNINKVTLSQQLSNNNVYISNRGNALRISINIFNTKDDIDALINCLQNAMEN